MQRSTTQSDDTQGARRLRREGDRQSRASTLKTLDETDPTFLADLKKSDEAVQDALKWLHRQGYKARALPVNENQSIKERISHVDTGDIKIESRIEVKERNLDFRTAKDFPYDTIIVDVCHTWDNSRPKPAAYLIFNKSHDAMFIVYGHTYDKWTKLTKYDTRVKRERCFYECPICYAKFVTL